MKMIVIEGDFYQLLSSVSGNILKEIKYLDVGPQAQLPPPYAEDINALLTMS